ncbi:Ada metal-binding domain-containing protein [Spirosoma pollinicola]|uniref:Metal-binding protein n=1 Tax=Spirosoma pollinicola TaxID=2057025 RepID=A0A2K8YXY0_9BACT|nr:Ada metal-binding domain-containing protein [Spirosoma pollinicola]AUD02490.1 metal-binding protein [Spirosoma pollinicola]
MIAHSELGPTPFARLRTLVSLIKCKEITLGGHRPSKIYGLLTCRAGKHMKAENRVFFRDETEATEQGFRPCAVCLPTAYKTWKTS